MSHPTAAELRQFLAGELAGGDRGRVESHVDGCERCLDALEAMQAPPTADVRFLARLIAQPPADVADKNGSADGAGQAGSLPASDPPPASRFAGYEILARVGGGGMGEVYRARHLRTGRTVALKTLTPAADVNSQDYAERLERFRVEAEAVSRLQHPHVVSVYEVGEPDGRSSRWSGWRAAAWPRRSPATRSPSARRPSWSPRWRVRSTTSTATASCTGT